MTSREALLQKARKYAIERIKPQTLDPLCDLNAVAEIATDFCLSELAAENAEIQKLRAIIFRMSSHMDAARAEGRNCGGIVGALVIPAGAPRCPKCGIYYPESPCIICQLRAEAALQREGQ